MCSQFSQPSDQGGTVNEFPTAEQPSSCGTKPRPAVNSFFFFFFLSISGGFKAWIELCITTTTLLPALSSKILLQTYICWVLGWEPCSWQELLPLQLQLWLIHPNDSASALATLPSVASPERGVGPTDQPLQTLLGNLKKKKECNLFPPSLHLSGCCHGKVIVSPRVAGKGRWQIFHLAVSHQHPWNQLPGCLLGAPGDSGFYSEMSRSSSHA